MRDTATETASETTPETTPETTLETAPETGSAPVGRRGRTLLADTVVATIAGRAAREVDGVHDLGGAAERTVGRLREKGSAGRPDLASGVSIEVRGMQAAVDLHIVADYGTCLTDLSMAVRRNVVAAVESMTGLQVTEVNIAVGDLHMEGSGRG